MWESLEKKYLMKSTRSRLHLKRRFYCFQLKRELFIDEHMNNYMKLLADLINVDVEVEEDDEAVIFLNSLPYKEYGTFVLNLINGKQTLNYSDVSAALINYEARWKDKQSSSNGTSTEALTVRGKGSNRKGKGERERSKSRSNFRDLKKNQCALCKKLGYWKIDCLKIKDKNKESKIEANLVRMINTQSGNTSQAGGSDSDSTIFSLSLLLILVTQAILSGC